MTRVLALAGLALCSFPAFGQTTQLPPAGGSYVDPVTGNTVYRLSDRQLCPGGANHLYADTTEFSIQGYVVFQCRTNPSNLNIWKWVVYDANMQLKFADATAAANFPDAAYNLQDVQWSGKRQVLYGTKSNGEVWEIDPFNGSSRLLFRFPERPHDFRIGPNDEMIARSNDKNRIHFWNGAALWTKDVGALAPNPDQPTVTLLGEPHYTWYQKPQRKWDRTGANGVIFDDNHGHTGHFRGSNGKVYVVKGQNETLANGQVGNIGCNPDGLGWRPKYGLYNALTGRRELTWGCSLPANPLLGEEDKSHFARVSRANDYLVSTGKLYASRWKVNWANGTVVKDANFALVHLGNCGYWGLARGSAHPDATAVMFTSGMADGQVREVGGATKTCAGSEKDLDVYVAKLGASAPAPAPILAASPMSLTFSSVQGGSAPAAKTVQITNAGGGTLAWTASSNRSWLTLSANSGSAPASLSVAVSPSGLLAGTYTGAVTISASGAQGSPVTIPVTLTISLPAGSISAFSLSPNPVLGGASTTGTITIGEPAPIGGKAVTLSSASAAAKVPASVTIPAGATAVSFAVTTTAVATQQQIAITATTSGSVQALLVVNPAAADTTRPSISITGNSLASNCAVTVTFSAADNVGVVRVEAWVSGNLKAVVSPPVSAVTFSAAGYTGTIRVILEAYDAAGNHGAAWRDIPLPVMSIVNGVCSVVTSLAVSSVTVSPNPMTSGTTATGTVRLTVPAPSGGKAVALSSSSAALQVPAFVTVPAGSTSATFSVTSWKVLQVRSATITATLNGSRQVTVTLNP